MKILKKTLALVSAMSLLLVGCSSTPQDSGLDDTSNPSTEISFVAGTYTGNGEGHGGDVSIEVSFSDTEIESIEVISHNETEGLGTKAFEEITPQVLEFQSLAVDTVSGATVSSNAFIAAIEDATEQAGGNIELLKSREIKKENEGVVEEIYTDVVVIGAGASGVSAAVSAADLGAEVVIIEKTSTIGGASNLSWAGKFYNSSAALEAGVEVDLEAEIAHWIADSHWRVDAAAIRQYVTQSGETYDWLLDKGYATSFLNFGGEQLHVLPEYETREQTLLEMLDESVIAGGGQVLTETTGNSLITDDNGNVIGVVATQQDGKVLEIYGDSVVIATGGYAANAEMVKDLFGFEGVNGGLGQNIGEGLEMAWDVGAKVPDNIGGQMLHQTLAPATNALMQQYEPFEASYPVMLTYLPTVMNVGPSGARFRDEAMTLEAVAAANTSAFNGAYHYVIVSADQIDALINEGMNGIGAPRLPGMPPEFYADFADQFALDTPWENAYDVFDSMVENGDGYKGNTIEELAINAGMDVDVFTAAFEQYIESTETGVDTAFGKSDEYLVPMGTDGPFYAIKAEINNLGSVGGLLVNTNFQVLDDNRIPINGLYAVGLESEGVLYNDTYVGNGVGLGYAFTSGRIGGYHAATHALAND